MNAFLARLWSLRLVRFGAWSLISLITLCVLLCTVVSWSGVRRWAAVKAMVAREGETLDFNQLMAQPIDDSHNFCAIELLRGINVPGDGKSAPGIKRAALESAGWQQVKGNLVVPSLREGPALGKPADMAAWAAFARVSKYVVPTAPSGDAAHDLLAGIDASHPLLKQLAEAVAARPEALFVPVLTPSRPLFAMELPHYSAVQHLGSALALRSLAACEAGDHTGACQSALAVLRLTDAAQREPFLIGALIAMVTHTTGEEAVWTILRKRQATDAELQALQTSLEKLDFRKTILTAMRGEMASAIDTLEYLQAGPSRAPDLLAVIPSDGSPQPDPWLARMWWNLVPTGWFDHNKAVIATMEMEGCIRPLKQGSGQDTLRRQAVFETELRTQRGLLHPDRFMANLIVPAITSTLGHTFAAEALRRQAMTACALERYYLAHQAYPADLSGLAPAFLATVPADPVDDQPLRYRQTTDGRYRLWSIGLDLKDDGGKVNISADANDRGAISQMYRSTYKGDWTWQYTPVK